MKTCVLLLLLQIPLFVFSQKSIDTDDAVKASVFQSFLTELEKMADGRDFTFKNIDGECLLPMKDGKADLSRILFVENYVYDSALLVRCDTIDLDRLFVFKPDKVTVLFFRDDSKSELVGFTEGRRNKAGEWEVEWGVPGWLEKALEEYSYYLKRFGRDELIVIDRWGQASYYGSRKDGGRYFESKIKSPSGKVDELSLSIAKSMGIKLEGDVFMYGEDAICEMLRSDRKWMKQRHLYDWKKGIAESVEKGRLECIYRMLVREKETYDGTYNEKMATDKASKPQVPDTVKVLAQGDAFIDVDVDVFRNLRLSDLLSPKLADDMVKATAILYRFFKHVKLSDGQYRLNLENPEKLNFNVEIYDVLVEDLNKINRMISEAKAQGQELHIVPIGEKY